MPSISSAEARLDELMKEVARGVLDGGVSDKRMSEIEAESDRLEIQIKNEKAARGWAGSASPAEYGMSDTNPGSYDGGGGFSPGVKWKSFGLPNPELHPQVAAPSMDISREQITSLFEAAHANAKGYKVQIGRKDFASTLRSKTAGAPLTESGLNNQLPAIQVPGNYGQYGKPYEPFRLLANIPTVAMTGPQAAYLTWISNTNNAARVAEGGEKPSLGPVIDEDFVKPMKLAATVEASMEILQDHEQFAQWLPTGLQQNLVNAESLQLIQANASGGPTVPEFNGLLATSGTLAQDATGLSFADALSMAYVKIRTGAAICEPHLVLTSPDTAAAALRSKTSTGAYIFDLMRGPGALDQQNEFDVFGVPVRTSTQCPDGTAIVMSRQGGAVVGSRAPRRFR
jgi:hypothetical protein